MSSKRPVALIRALSTAQLPSRRCLHRLNSPALRIPKPTPFVPDVQTFLTLIGRGLSQHSSKIPSWEALFTLSSQQLRESGVEPARARRYLLWWRERFRNGLTGIGGDLTHVKDGVGELRVVEVPSSDKQDQIAMITKSPGMKKIVINTAYSLQEERKARLAPLAKIEAGEAAPVAKVRVVAGMNIGGKGLEPVKGQPGVARLRVREGLWEQKRGHKIDGGERRKAEVRAKRRAEERKNAR